MQNANTKLITISLNATVPASYEEVVRVPADITEEETCSLIRQRWLTVGGDEFVIDHGGFEEGSNYSTDCEQNLQPAVVATRVKPGDLQVEEVAGAGVASSEVATEEPSGIFIRYQEDLHTLIAALRFWQEKGMCDPFQRSDEMQDLATGGGEFTSACDEDIDRLVESINKEHDPVVFRAELEALINSKH